MTEELATVIASIIAAVASILAAVFTGFVAVRSQHAKMQRDYELDSEGLRTRFMAEQVAKQLLESDRWKKRSFEAIKDRLGGFEDDDLRQILVRAGAVRYKDASGEELWGLLSRNGAE